MEYTTVFPKLFMEYIVVFPPCKLNRYAINNHLFQIFKNMNINTYITIM